jgi:hypothetical protein
MDGEMLGKLSKRHLALDCGQRHHRLECRRMVPARSSAHRGSRAILARRQAELPLIALFSFTGLESTVVLAGRAFADLVGGSLTTEAPALRLGLRVRKRCKGPTEQRHAKCNDQKR